MGKGFRRGPLTTTTELVFFLCCCSFFSTHGQLTTHQRNTIQNQFYESVKQWTSSTGSTAVKKININFPDGLEEMPMARTKDGIGLYVITNRAEVEFDMYAEYEPPHYYFCSIGILVQQRNPTMLFLNPEERTEDLCESGTYNEVYGARGTRTLRRQQEVRKQVDVASKVLPKWPAAFPNTNLRVDRISVRNGKKDPKKYLLGAIITTLPMRTRRTSGRRLSASAQYMCSVFVCHINSDVFVGQPVSRKGTFWAKNGYFSTGWDSWFRFPPSFSSTPRLQCNAPPSKRSNQRKVQRRNWEHHPRK